ncbi:hypothetical protein TMatcc_009354 [Talaromyces marneffei ATCC 18224]
MGSTSTTSSLVLEEATIEDFPAIRDIWFAAFTQPVIGAIPRLSGDEQSRPRLVAFGKWDLSMPEERGRRFPQWHPSSPYERCEEFIDILEKERMRVMGDEKHYYLDTVGTHPNYQRRGAGSMLVQWGCDLADRDDVSAYVDASKEGAPVYQKHGFVDYSLPGSDVASLARRKKTA